MRQRIPQQKHATGTNFFDEEEQKKISPRRLQQQQQQQQQQRLQQQEQEGSLWNTTHHVKDETNLTGHVPSRRPQHHLYSKETITESLRRSSDHSHHHHHQQQNHLFQLTSTVPSENSFDDGKGCKVLETTSSANLDGYPSAFHSDPSFMHRTPLIVPDCRYKAFLIGQPLHRKRKGYPTYFRPECCASFCTYFSLIAACFLLWVAILVDRQPLYIQGVLPQLIDDTGAGDGSKRVILYETSSVDRLPAALHAYQAAFAYFITFLLSIFYTHYSWIQSQLRRRHYQDVPDAMSTTTTFHTNHNIGDSHHENEKEQQRQNQASQRGGEEGDTIATPAYELSLMNRIVAVASTGSVMMREMTSKWKWKTLSSRKRTAKHN